MQSLKQEKDSLFSELRAGLVGAIALAAFTLAGLSLIPVVSWLSNSTVTFASSLSSADGSSIVPGIAVFLLVDAMHLAALVALWLVIDRKDPDEAYRWLWYVPMIAVLGGGIDSEFVAQTLSTSATTYYETLRLGLGNVILAGFAAWVLYRGAKWLVLDELAARKNLA